MAGVRAANPQVDVMQFRLSMFIRCDRLIQLAVCDVHSSVGGLAGLGRMVTCRVTKPIRSPASDDGNGASAVTQAQ